MILTQFKPINALPFAAECDYSTRRSEEQFYALYDWCLDPVLSLSDLLARIGEELDRWGRLSARWQREESRINLYLFSCAAACTIDDYLALPAPSIAGLAERYPLLKLPVAAGQAIINGVHGLPWLRSDRSVASWRNQWSRFLDQVCELLIREEELDVKRIHGLQTDLQALLNAKLPHTLLMRRMILPEGYRCQDLAHQDLQAMVRQAVSRQGKDCRFGIIGPRTFGSYFAPLVKACLSALGYAPAVVMTVRPKWGISGKERRKLRQLVSACDHVLIVDDYPNTGATLKKMIALLRSFGAGPGRISFLAPTHPAQKLAGSPVEKEKGAEVERITVNPEELHKERFLKSPAVESLLREYFFDQGWKRAELEDNPEVDKINALLQQHYSDGFHVRLKKVLAVRLKENGTTCVKKVLAKSVGWGWLGYHAYLTGTRLAAFVPKVIGLRNGLLFTEWLEDGTNGREEAVGPELISRLSSYISRRTQSLALSEDPWFASPGYRWTGWDAVLDIVRSAYGSSVDRLAVPLLRRSIRTYVSPLPTLVDGHMKRAEWIKNGDDVYKVDFEHHNFGGPELDMTDPAYDLASAIYEFRLSEQEEGELLRAYEEKSGDQNAARRVDVHKLLYGMTALQQAAYWVPRAPSERKKEEWNKDYLRSRNFLIHQLHRFCARSIAQPQRTHRSGSPFFLDLDGVLDTETLGFPHTTYSGILALRLLQHHGFSVVLNTGRSAEQVAAYCTTYGLAGGIGEYGSVFFDAVQGREVPLIDEETAVELNRCREALRKIPGVFLDPAYRYSLRAYRYRGARTEALAPGEADSLLAGLQTRKLAVISQGNTFIVQKGIDKGSGFAAAKKIMKHEGEPVFAMGDTEQDRDMLEAADHAFAPSNSSSELYRLARTGKCTIMPLPYQRGLLAAVRECIRIKESEAGDLPQSAFRAEDRADLLWFLLQVAELPRLQQVTRTMQWSLFGRRRDDRGKIHQ